MKTSLCAVACVAASWIAAESEAVTQEQLDLEAKRQARSVHLGWTDVPDGSAFFNEVQVRESVPGTYFCVIGFQMGYFGIQELTDGKKVVIFSVWEPPNPVNADDPGKTEAARRTQLVYQGDGVRVGRFGGEGTGGQSFFDYPWRLNETYRFVVHAKPAGDRTVFTGYFFVNETRTWKKLVSFSTLTDKHAVSGLYSFIEDFRRNFQSAKQRRQSLFGHGWVLDKEGRWRPATAARFTGDRNPVMTINAGLRDDWFFLETGGGVTNLTPLRSLLRLAPPVTGLSFE
ncbi:MAG TPA: DUF3472 domain-containing protein [Kiritimatiellia bacterium]|nr:DUF3472 domain-containing protein [Kiritimatiellia bacterium]HPS06627.1 DUF3472 domain-containing protein [Kiritimatiellia bacterium]